MKVNMTKLQQLILKTKISRVPKKDHSIYFKNVNILVYSDFHFERISFFSHARDIQETHAPYLAVVQN